MFVLQCQTKQWECIITIVTVQAKRIKSEKL